MALTDDAIGKIKGMIQRGELAPGDKLPPEQELGERLGLSRSSLREAVKALEAMRVLDVRRGDGTYVTSLEPSLLLEAMSFVLDFHVSHAVLEVFTVRRMLEPATAALAAVQATEEQLAQLRAHLERVDEGADLDSLIENDVRFHSLIAAATGNGYLESLLATISSQTTRARIWRGVDQEGSIGRTLAEHIAILDAIEARDPELARAAMTIHVCGVERWLQAQVEHD